MSLQHSRVMKEFGVIKSENSNLNYFVVSHFPGEENVMNVENGMN